jgi:hypothetical protein
MKIRPRIVAILVNAALAGAMHGAHADDAHALTHEILAMDSAAGSHGSNTVTNRIAVDFESFAGSQKNATALVTGLREGSEITLVQRGHRPATFTPPTGKMGYGNVSTSLALAQYQLAQYGISDPTPLQLKAALNGGTIFVNHKPVTLDGVLQMRADGLGWGRIAQNLGTKLGPVVSGIKSQNAQIAAVPRVHATTATTATTTGSVGTAAQARSSGSQGGAKGIVNAGGGASPGAGKGKDDIGISTASSRPQAGRGVVTAGGQTVVSAPRGNANGHSASVVTAAGGGASSGAVTAAGTSAGNAGGGQGQGKAFGHSK